MVMSTCVYGYGFISLGYVPGSGTAGSQANSMSTFGGTTKLFPYMTAPFANPTSKVGGTYFPRLLVRLAVARLSEFDDCVYGITMGAPCKGPLGTRGTLRLSLILVFW